MHLCLAQQQPWLTSNWHGLSTVYAGVGAQIEVVADSEADFRVWDGWVHSRLRQLVMRIEQHVSVSACAWTPAFDR